VLRWDVGATAVRARRRRDCGGSARSAQLRCERDVVAGAKRARGRRGCRAEPEVVAGAGRVQVRHGCGSSTKSARLQGERNVDDVVMRSAAV
jgi:hypothetical protein